MKTLLTEPEAWRVIAKAFAGQPTWGTSTGLCAAVDDLEYDGKIDRDTELAMCSRIQYYLDGGWAYTTVGDVFCYSDGRVLYEADFSPEARKARSMAALWLALDAEAEGV